MITVANAIIKKIIEFYLQFYKKMRKISGMRLS